MQSEMGLIEILLKEQLLISLERREETRTNLNTNRIDEENQTKLFCEVECGVVNAHPEVAQRDADKENPSNTNRNTFNFKLAQRNTNGNRDCDDKDVVGYATAKYQIT